MPTLQTAIAQSRHQLALLTGRTAAELSLPEGGAVPQPADDLALAFPADTLRQRPDVRAAEARVSAAAQRVVQAEAARYPSFSLSGSLGLSALTLSGLTGGGAAAGCLAPQNTQCSAASGRSFAQLTHFFTEFSPAGTARDLRCTSPKRSTY